MNKVQILGRLTKDPELRTTSTGRSVARFTLAVDKRYSKNQNKQANFISVVAWGRSGEVISQYFRKGHRIAIDGYLDTSTYDDKNGNRVYRTDVIVENFDFIEYKKNSNSEQPKMSSGSEERQLAEGPPMAVQQEYVPMHLDEDFHLMEPDDQDCPF